MITELPWVVAQSTSQLTLPSGAVAPIRVARVRFPAWTGVEPRSRWGKKPVVGPPEQPFAELAIAGHLAQRGWAGAWVYRSGRFLSSWEPRSAAVLSPEAVQLFQRISEKAGGASGGWDVYAWRSGAPLFVEVKWPRDRIRASQLRWLEAALDLGVKVESFIVAECEQLH